MKSPVSIGISIVVAIVTLSLAPPVHAQPLPLSDRQFVDATVTQAMKTGRVPGMTISVSGPKGDYTKSYGYANMTLRTALDPADHFRAGSITKLFTATAILEQVDKGKISLEDTVKKFIPNIPNGNLITVRDLLSMRSGLYEYTNDPGIQLMLAAYPPLPVSPPQRSSPTTSSNRSV